MSSNSKSVQALWVAIGSVISYGFILLTSMILSRYFEKGDYGTYKQVMYVYNTFLVVFTLGLPRAYSYFLPRIPLIEVKDTINKITYLFLFLGFLFSLLLFFGSPLLSSLLKNPDLEYAIKLFSLVPLFMLPTMGLEGILATFNKTRYIALYKGISSFFQLICVAVPVVFFKGTYESAIIGFTISSFLICIIAMYLKNLPTRFEKKMTSSVKYRDIFSFSIPLLFASLWGILMNSSDQYFISSYFGKEVFAEFSNGWIDLPLVSMAIGSTAVVLLPVFSKLINENELAYEKIKPIWINVFEKTVKLVYPFIIYSIVFSEEIMILLYGDSYSNSSVFFSFKLIINFFNLIAFAPLMLALGATKYYAKVIAYGALATVLLEFIFVNIFNSPYVITTISILSSLGVVLFQLKFVAKFLKTSVINLFPLKLMLSIIFVSLPILLLLYLILVLYLSFDTVSTLIISFLVYFISFFYISKMIGIDYLSVIKQFIKK